MTKGDSDDGSASKVGKGKRVSGKDRPVRWFNPSPTDGDKLWLDDNSDQLVELGLSVLDAVPEDGRLTVKYDVDSTRWLAILFLRSNEEGYEMDAMSVRGASAFDALCLLAYFHFTKYDEAWVQDPDQPRGRWG